MLKRGINIAATLIITVAASLALQSCDSKPVVDATTPTATATATATVNENDNGEAVGGEDVENKDNGSVASGETTPQVRLTGNLDKRVKEYQEMVLPLFESNLLGFEHWSNIEDIDHESLLKYTAAVSDSTDFKKQGESVTMPEASAEAFIASRFYGDPTLIRQSKFYDAATKTYKVTTGASKTGSIKVTNVVEALNTYVTAEQFASESDKLPENVITLCLSKASASSPKFISSLKSSYDKSAYGRLSDPEASYLLNKFIAECPDDSKSELFAMVSMLAPAGESLDFDSSSKISSEQLFRFYLNMTARDNERLQAGYNDADGYYHFNVGEIIDFCSKYFSDFNFDPGSVKSDNPVIIYSQMSNEILVPEGVGYVPSTDFYEILEQTVVSTDTLKITADRLAADGTAAALSKDTLTIRVFDGGLNFVSFTRG